MLKQSCADTGFLGRISSAFCRWFNGQDALVGSGVWVFQRRNFLPLESLSGVESSPAVHPSSKTLNLNNDLTLLKHVSSG